MYPLMELPFILALITAPSGYPALIPGFFLYVMEIPPCTIPPNYLAVRCVGVKHTEKHLISCYTMC